MRVQFSFFPLSKNNAKIPKKCYIVKEEGGAI